MSLCPVDRPAEPDYPRRRPRRPLRGLGAASAIAIVATALGCTSAAQAPPAATPPVVVQASPGGAAAEREPVPRPEPDWELEEGFVGLAERPVPAAAALAERAAPGEVTPAHGARIMGSISREVIREGVRGGLDDFRACYEGPAGQSLGDSVPVSLRFTIAADGSVRDAEARVGRPGGFGSPPRRPWG